MLVQKLIYYRIPLAISRWKSLAEDNSQNKKACKKEKKSIESNKVAP